MTKVLLFLGNFGRGGVQSFVMTHIEKMNHDELTFDVYSMLGDSSPYEETIKKWGGNVYYGHDQYSPAKVFSLMRKWESFFKEGKYDVIHVHLNLVNAWVLLAAKKAGVPVRLSHSHSTEQITGGLVQKLYSLLRRSIINHTATTCLSCGRDAGYALYGKKKAFTVINNGIEIERFVTNNEEAIQSLAKEYSIPRDKKIYANVTRISYQKNQPFVVDVFAEILKLEPESILLLGGPLDDTDAFIWDEAKAKITEYGIQKNIILLPSIQDMPSLYSLVDVWLSPSRWEGLPIALIELQAASVPTVASDVITDECDLGLGLVNFVPLSESPRKWAEVATSAKPKSFTTEEILDILKTKGFDVKTSAKELENYYCSKAK